MTLLCLPVGECLVPFRYCGVHHFAVPAGAGCQLDDISVGIPKIDRPNKTVVNGPAHFSTCPLRLLQHVIEGLWFDTERNVQIEWILRFEIERQSRHFEECQARAVLHLEEGMEGTGSLVCCRRIDLERADKAKTEEIFIKGSCLLGVPAPVGVVMQTLDHMTSHFGCSGWNTTDVAEGQQLAKSGSRYDRLPA
jgi:hypothetical protein